MCDNVISARILECNRKAQDLSNTIKGAMNNWSVKRGMSFAPFCDLNYVIKNSPTALSQDDG